MPDGRDNLQIILLLVYMLFLVRILVRSIQRIVEAPTWVWRAQWAVIAVGTVVMFAFAWLIISLIRREGL